MSAAMSLDGYLDDCSSERLRLSSDEDWVEVLALRATCDAILVGAGTLRADNPSLMVKDPKVRAEAGLTEDLIKVTLTASGNIDCSYRFFTVGDSRKIVFTTTEANADRVECLKRCSEVIVQDRICAKSIVSSLEAIGCKTLLVEGGTKVLTMFFEQDVVDELRLAVAPFFVGECSAPKFVNQARFPADKLHRMELCSVEKLGDMAVMHYKRKKNESR